MQVTGIRNRKKVPIILYMLMASKRNVTDI